MNRSQFTTTSSDNRGSYASNLLPVPNVSFVTTKSNLQVAREWLDANLEPMIRKSIPLGIDPPTSSLPRRLDKPTFTKTSHSYADILKQQFSLALDSTTATVTNTRPPRKRQATIFDYDSDQSTDYPLLNTTTETKPTNTTSAANSTGAQPAMGTSECTTLLLELKTEINMLKTTMQPQSNATSTTVDYAAELESLKRDLQSLRTFITTAVEQLKTEILSTNATLASNNTTDVDHAMDYTPNILELIVELKQDIAAVIKEMKTLFQNERRVFIPFELTPMPPMPT